MLLEILVQGNVVREFRCGGPVSMGRQDPQKGEPEPFALLSPGPLQACHRLIFAPASDYTKVSRVELTVSKVGPDSLRIDSGHNAQLTLGGPTPLSMGPGQSLAVPAPVTVGFHGYPHCAVRISSLDVPPPREIANLTQSVLRLSRSRIPAGLGIDLTWAGNEDWLKGMETAIHLMNQTLTGQEFLPGVAQAIRDFAGLDRGRVFFHKDGDWVEASRFPQVQGDFPFSKRALAHIEEHKTPYSQTEKSPDLGKSQVSGALSILIAVPFFGPNEELLGALMGEKSEEEPRQGKRWADSFTVWMSMLAATASVGLRLGDEQRKALEAESRFAAFTSKKLARSILEDPSLLDGREETITVLFADIRGFSRISKNIGPQLSIDWITAVMEVLTETIELRDGLTTGYLGDGLMAIWGTPFPTRAHALEAVRAGMDLLQACEKLDAVWSPRIGEATKIGLGINTGIAMVGNVGSARKVQYGALGNTVNVASRVEGLTKYLKCPLLVTGQTKKCVSGEFLFRRVCRTRVANIDEPIDIFEPGPAEDSSTRDLFSQTELALEALENGNWTEAARLAGAGLQKHRGDGPLILILSRASQALVEERQTIDPVWTPPGK